MRIFLSGDVMTGRGIDQALPYPCAPHLHEAYVEKATGYLRLAVEANGPIPVPVDFPYIWGAALAEWERARPDLRIINLETSITRNESYIAKGINYRMSAENALCLVAAGIDCCSLANNHSLDWERAGLLDTLARLAQLGIKTAGAGRNAADAVAPAVLALKGQGRVLVFAYALETSGVPSDWKATADAAGVNMLPDLSGQTVAAIADQVAAIRLSRDVVVISLHWGPNWGYDIPLQQSWFAHELIDKADASIIHGHSSHHPKAIEVYGRRLILYGAGDFLNDYEGISGHEEFKADLALMYFADLDPVSRDLAGLELVPLKIHRFQLIRPQDNDIDWLLRMLDRQSRRFGTRVSATPEGRLRVSWPAV